MAAAALGVIVAVAVLVFGEAMGGRDPARNKEKDGEKAADSRILFSPPILLSLCFYMMLAMIGGVQIYGIVALQALWGVSLSLATTALTATVSCRARYMPICRGTRAVRDRCRDCSCRGSTRK